MFGFLQTLADTVSEADLKVGRLYPPLQDIQSVSIRIATAIVEDAYAHGKGVIFVFCLYLSWLNLLLQIFYDDIN